MLTGKQAMRYYWKEHLSLYIFIAVIFATGVVFGAVLVHALTLDVNQEMRRHLENFLHTVDQGLAFDANKSYWQIFSLNIKWILLIWLFGLSVIGLPLILILDFLKGALIGFSFGFLIGEYAWKGMVLSLAGIVPQNLVLIPAILMVSVAGMSFSIHLVKNRFLQRQGGIYGPFLRYSLITLGIVVLVAAVSFFEVYLSPQLMKSVVPMLNALAG